MTKYEEFFVLFFSVLKDFIVFRDFSMFTNYHVLVSDQFIFWQYSNFDVFYRNCVMNSSIILGLTVFYCRRILTNRQNLSTSRKNLAIFISKTPDLYSATQYGESFDA